MSRCFPYPPPGYTRNGIRDEALIESIKLQREVEVEKAKKEQRKEKKREKEERKKEKKREKEERKREKKREKDEREKVRGNGEVESKRDKEERKKEVGGNGDVENKREKEEKKKEKEKKWEKKERKKEKKRENAMGNGEVENRRHHHKKRHRDERNQEDQKGGDFEKKQKCESEHYEKSILTEEHGNPAGSQNSSDSTLNSRMIQKQGSPSGDRHNSGSIIRIRLPLQRHKDSEVLPTKEQPCSVLGTSESTSVEGTSNRAPMLGREGLKHPCSTFQIKDQELRLPVNNDKSHLCRGTFGSSTLQAKSTSVQGMSEPAELAGEGLKHVCSTSQSTDRELPSTVSKDKSRLSHGASGSSTSQVKSTLHTGLSGSSPPPEALQFRDLVENWVPSKLLSECLEPDDQTWLFGINQERIQNSKARSCAVPSVGSSYLNSTSWPCAHYLSDVETYALPFTVPF